MTNYLLARKIGILFISLISVIQLYLIWKCDLAIAEREGCSD